MQIVPLQPTASQTVNILLGNQNCQITVSQKGDHLFCDLAVNNAAIINGVICENRNRIVRSAYLGFVGDLAFNDSQGTDDPIYTGLGTRFFLLYLEEADLA